MTRRTTSLVCGGIAAVGAACLVWSASGAGGPAPPVTPDLAGRGASWSEAARRAFGQRVLVLSRKRGAPRSGAIRESARNAGVWMLHPAEPPGAKDLEGALWRLAQAAADTYDEERRKCTPDVERALDLFGVKSVLVDDRVVVNEPVVVARPDAEPVVRAASESPSPAETAAGAADPVALAAALGATQARFLDWDDELWGGGLVVEVPEPGRYVFPFAAEGARVTVDGEPVTPGRAGPLLALVLPAGKLRVEVSYRPQTGSIVAVAGAVLLSLGAIGLLLALRPTQAEIDAATGSDGPANGA